MSLLHLLQYCLYSFYNYNIEIVLVSDQISSFEILHYLYIASNMLTFVIIFLIVNF